MTRETRDLAWYGPANWRDCDLPFLFGAEPNTYMIGVYRFCPDDKTTKVSIELFSNYATDYISAYVRMLS